MSQRLPEFIEPYRLAENRRILKGQLSITSMKRLAPLLADTAGDVELSLTFDVDETGQANVKGSVTANLKLQCQRCMQAMDYSIRARVSLAFIRTEEQAQDLPSHYEPSIVEEELLLPELVEDEIILALPAVPLHDPDSCSAAMQFVTGNSNKSKRDESGVDTGSKSANPFAVLEKLRSKD